jgi:hypothetical protein
VCWRIKREGWWIRALRGPRFEGLGYDMWWAMRGLRILENEWCF